MTGTCAGPWTGRLEFDLCSGQGWSVATVEVAVRLDTVSFGIGRRNLGVIERGAFREWLHRSDLSLAVDDLVFQLMGPDLCVIIDGSIPYPLPARVVTSLMTLV